MAMAMSPASASEMRYAVTGNSWKKKKVAA